MRAYGAAFLETWVIEEARFEYIKLKAAAQVAGCFQRRYVHIVTGTDGEVFVFQFQHGYDRIAHPVEDAEVE